MKKTGTCTSLVFNNGIAKVTITIDTIKQPEYALLLNVIKEHIDFEQGDTVEIIVRKVTKRNAKHAP